MAETLLTNYFNKALGFSGQVQTIALFGTRVYLGGGYLSFSRQKVVRIAAFTDNSLDTAFLSGEGFNGLVQSIAPANDGSGDVYVGGQFTSYNGTSNVNYITRLNSDGSIDLGFNTGVGGTAGFDNSVYSIAPAGDGSGDVYVGGNFTSYNATPNVNRITRLNSDGSIDLSFNTGSGGTAGFDNFVFSVATAGDSTGDVYVGGSFVSYNGTSNVRRVSRLNSDGSIDLSFNIGSGGTAGFNDSVSTITPAADGSGDVYVGGSFVSYNGTSNVRRVSRLNSDGSIDLGFNIGSGGTAGYDSAVYSIALAGDGSGDVYLGGNFTSYNGTSNVRRISRLNSDGSIDVGFITGSGGTAGFNLAVRSVYPALDGTGDVYVGGQFTSYNGTSNVNYITRLNSDGSIDFSFNTGSGATAGFDIWPYSLAPAADGSGDVYVGGWFTSYNGTSNVNRITRLNSDGSIDLSFNTGTGGAAGFNSFVYFLTMAGDGSGDAYVGGDFTSYNGTSNVNRITRLNSDGTIDLGFNTGSGGTSGFSSTVRFIAPAGDGSGDVYVGGAFPSFNGNTDVRRIARLNSDGSVDLGFNTGSGGTAGFSSTVYSIVPAGDGSGDVYVGGNFTSYNGVSNVNRITRLNSDGSIDLSFNTGTGATAGVNGTVWAIASLGDGSGGIYVGGDFTSYNGTSNVNRIARLNADGTIDLSFNTGTGATSGLSATVNSIAPAGDGSGDVYVGGAFTSYNGTPNVNRITRLNSDGSIDLGFSTGSGGAAGLNDVVYSIAPAGDGNGNVYVGGVFNAYNGITHAYIALLSKVGQSL